MEDCCHEPNDAPGATANCPACGARGSDLDETTLKALLRPAALARRSEIEHRFCATSSCPVVYFGKEERFTRDDLAVPVFQKETGSERPVCYCFDVSESDIREEVARTGQSGATGRIKALIQADRCACELRNPQGSCCLGNVATTERMAREREGALR